MTRIYVPCDSSALALGADHIAQAIAGEAARRGIDIELVRNGSRGLLWLEPLVEVETAPGRIGYANVDVDEGDAFCSSIDTFLHPRLGIRVDIDCYSGGHRYRRGRGRLCAVVGQEVDWEG